MATRKASQLTDTQFNNLSEWLDRMGDRYDAILIFNALTPRQQQNIYSRPWFSLTTGGPIRRPLLPTHILHSLHKYRKTRGIAHAIEKAHEQTAIAQAYEQEKRG